LAQATGEQNKRLVVVAALLRGAMKKLALCHDRTGNTLTVWFGDPSKEAVCEEADDDVVLMKDRRGRVIGFERLNYLSKTQRSSGDNVPVEVQVL
jgi:hypothetical protein